MTNKKNLIYNYKLNDITFLKEGKKKNYNHVLVNLGPPYQKMRLLCFFIYDKKNIKFNL